MEKLRKIDICVICIKMIKEEREGDRKRGEREREEKEKRGRERELKGMKD